jgi:hypothetical protein
MSSGRASRGPVQAVLLGAVRFYQRAIGPTLPPRCRFYPSCSAYALEALEQHGAARGSWLAARRLAKCAPWHPGGVDPVPEPRQRRSAPGPLPGTPEPGHSSCTAAAPAEPSPPDRITPPALRAPQEESSLA